MPLFNPALEQITLLEEQLNIYVALNGLSIRKEKALSLADIAELDGIISAEQALIINIVELEKRRFANQKQIAEICLLPVEKLTMGAIADLIDDKEASTKLNDIQNELTVLLAEIRERNDRCQQIITGALELVQRQLDKGNSHKGSTLVDRRV